MNTAEFTVDWLNKAMLFHYAHLYGYAQEELELMVAGGPPGVLHSWEVDPDRHLPLTSAWERLYYLIWLGWSRLPQ